MKIVVCVKLDLEGNIALNRLAPALGAHELSIILSDKVTRIERQVRQSAEFLFYERDLLVDHLFPLLDRIPPPCTQAENLTFHQLAERHRCPLRLIRDINAPDSEAYLRELRPDVILSVRYDLIFKPNVIRIPRCGIYNIHPGELPRYRGVYAPFRAMLQREEFAGCTLHRVDEQIDGGPVVGIRRLRIDPSRSVLWHMAHLYPLGIELFLDLLPRLEQEGALPASPQDESQMRYYTFPTAAEFQELVDRGGSLIDPGDYLELLAAYHRPAEARKES